MHKNDSNDRQEPRRKIENYNKFIYEQQEAIQIIGCDPTWELFEKSYGWFMIKKELTDMKKQDKFQENWFRIYRKKKGVSGKLAGKPGHTLMNQRGSSNSRYE